MGVQKRTDLDWEDLRVFLAVARTASLSGAARALGVNHATVSRRLARLQACLQGAPLLERRPEGFILSPEGLAALNDAEAMEKSALALAQRCRIGPEVAGLVRVSTLASFAEHFLASRIGMATALYPALQVELVGEDRNVNLERGEAEIAVRFGRKTSGDALVRKLTDLSHYLYASPDYLRRVPKPNWSYIGFGKETERAPTDLAFVKFMHDRNPSIRINSLGAQREAAGASAGVALLPSYLGDEDKRLVRAESVAGPTLVQSIWLLVRADADRTRAVRVLADLIAAWILAEIPLLSGKAVSLAAHSTGDEPSER